MNHRKFLPLLLLLPLLSCDRDDLRGDSASSSTVSLAPRLVSITGAELPHVDSVRIKIVNSSSNSGYYEKMVDWNKHGDTIVGIPKSTPLKVSVAGLKIQADGSLAEWWSGSYSATFGGDQSIGVQSFPVPVAIGDTVAPVIVSRTKDTIQTRDSTLRLVWNLGKDTGIVAVVNGDTLRPKGDSLVWTHPWNASGKNEVVAIFRDATGNTTRDSFTVVRSTAPGRVALPLFSVAPGTYNDSIRVALSDSTAGAKIEFRLDSTGSWSTYSDPIPLGSNTKLQARATKSGLDDSPIARATYTFTVADPAFSVTSGTSSNDFLAVKISCATPSARIEYSLDSTNWRTSTDSLVLGAPTTIWARALKAGLQDSRTVRAIYDVRAAAPKFGPPAGSYDSALALELTTTTPGAAIHYTLDSTVPTDSSPTYSSPIELRSTKTVMAIATKKGLATSLLATAKFSIDTLKAPKFDPPGGTFQTAQSVAISSIYDSASIYYTLDGTTPTPSSTRYETPIQVSGNVTIKAIAVTRANTVTAVASASYQIGTVGTPIFTPAAGGYLSAQSVAISCPTVGASIRYTTDGSAPTETSTLYTQPIAVSTTTTIRAIAFAEGWTPSPEASATYFIGAASAPTFSPPAGTYAGEQSVSLSSSTKDAVIYFTTDGATPNKASAKYTGAISLTVGKTIKAIAVVGDSIASEVASATYLIGTAATPVLSLEGGPYLTARKVALSTATPGATIHYTTDGSDPTSSSTLYTDSIEVASGLTLKAIALAEGMEKSAVASAKYTIGTAGTPVFTPSAGTYGSAQTVTLTSSLEGAAIYYTTDGSDPTENSTKYTAPLSVSVGQTIKAYSVASGASPSTIASATYLIGAAAAPSITPPAGTYPAAQNVTLSSETPAAAIYYTLDGATPTPSSTRYTTAIDVSSGKTLKAIAVADGMAPSPVSSATYLIGAAAAPTFTPPGGSYADTQFVAMASTKGATIYYTTDGSAPSTLSKVYTGPVTVAKGMVLQAMATAPGMANSPVATSSYLIGSALPPTFLPLGGTYLTGQWVKMASTTPGTVIYYTTDGTDPTTSSSLFTDSLHVTSGLTIKAMATGGGVSNSAVASATYVIGTAGTPTFSPAAGAYGSAQLVALSSSLDGATIYYTTDGTPPTANSNRYSAPLTVSKGQTISAIAMAPGKANSSIASATYVIGSAAAPTFTPPQGTYPSGQSVVLASQTAGATIYYTLDGSTPTNKSSVYTVALNIGKGQTVKAIAVADGMSNSSLASATYLIGTVSAPSFNPISGSYTGTVWMGLTSATTGASIYYTTDGSDPTPGSARFTGTIPLYASDTIKAYAVVEGMAPSTVSVGRFLITASSPVFSVKSGTFQTTQSVTITSATPGAVVYYTTDGSTPTKGSTKYVGAIPVSYGQTIRAIAIADGTLNSEVVSETYVIGTVSAPVFTPGTGSYTGTLNVSIASSTPGATVYYTRDGTTPTASSIPYTTPLSVSADDTIKAVATAPGMTSSGVTSAFYTFTAVPPAFNPAGGAYASAQNVALSSSTPNAAIYYTTDGTTPTPTNGTRYNGPVPVTAGQTLKAVATAPGVATSQIALATYVIGTAGLPSFSPAGGPYTGTQQVTLSSATSGAKIYYTTNNSTPTVNSTAYTGPIGVSVNQTIRAIAVAAGMSNSEVASETYSITASAPTFSPAGGTYGAAQQVTLSSATPGASIYYTIDGTTPTANSTPYNGSITVSGGTTIKAIAVANGTSNSQVSTAAYVIGAVSAPAFSPIAGDYTGTQSVSLSTGTSGASIYYTTDGGTPTDASTRYTVAIPVTATTTIKAIAVAAGMSSSAVSSALYTITAVAPTFSVASGTYPTAVSLLLSTPTPGAKIYYTTNGAIPTTGSTEYVGAINVDVGMVVNAIAKAPGTNASLMSSATYVIGSTSAPAFSPAPNVFGSAQSVTLSTSISGAKIYYTTNGNTPSAASTEYTAPIAVTANTTIKAIAIAAGMSNSDVSTGEYYIRAGAPTFTPGAGSYPTAKSVALASTTLNASIYYTTNGSAPSTNSFLYSTPILVDTNQTIRAIATATGMTNSVEASAAYTIQAATPSIDASGSFTGSKVVHITTTSPGAAIRYTTDGNDPTSSSALYSGSITVDRSMTLKAIAIASNLAPSPVASAAFTIRAVAPSFDLAVGSYATAQSLTLTSPTAGAAFRYTTDGSNPTSASLLYAGSIAVNRNMTVKAITTAAGLDSSAVTSAEYHIQATAPGFDLAEGTYSGSQVVHLSSTTPSATFRYTTDGSNPATSATALTYATSITVGQTTTLKAVTVASGFDTSAVSTAAYTIQAGSPVFSLASGTYTGTQSLTLTGPGQIRYTTDGTTPTGTSTLYASAISIDKGMDVKAISVVAGQANSPVASASYSIRAVAPAFDLAAGPHVGVQTLHLSSATSGVTFYYTTDGTDPTTASNLYPGAAGIAVDTSMTVTAIAVPAALSGVQTSAAASRSFTLQATAPGFGLAAGPYTGSKSVSLTATETGAVLHYTLDGSTPTAASATYSTALVLDTTTTVKAIAVVPGMVTSDVNSAAYTITRSKPTALPDGGSFSDSVLVSLTAENGASIYYSLDGLPPTTASTLYTQPFFLYASATLQAIAAKPGSTNSAVLSVDYLVTPTTP